MSRLRLFVENILIYGLGGSVSKIIPFLLLPYITSLLPDSKYYGYFDLVNITVNFSTALAILGMYDMMFRMFFEKESSKYKKEVCSSSLFPVLVFGLFILCILLVFNNFFSTFIFNSNEFSLLIIIAGFCIYTNALRTIVAAPTRMENKKITYITINILTSLVSYGLSIVLLLKGYFLLALPIGLLASSVFGLLIYSILNFKWFGIKFINFSLMKEMLFLGLPLVPVFLFYWVFNSFDRLMISKMLGEEYLGVYAVGAKMSSFSQLIYTAFSIGWQYFAFSTMKDKDQVKLTSKIFEYLGIISFVAVIIIIPFIKPFFEHSFEGDYINGFIVVPYLFLSPLILMLFQTGANQFLVIKKTYYFGFILLIGAIINVVFNYVFIPVLGIEGAAIATLLGYLTSTIIAVLLLLKFKLLEISSRIIYSFLLTISFLVITRIYSSIEVILILVTINLFTFAFLYRSDIKKYYIKFKQKLK